VTGGRPRVTSKGIAAGLRAAIERGGYDENSRLPSANALADAHGVDVTTAARALRALVDEGSAVGRRGSGTYAVPRPEVTEPPLRT
jgi:GntR family transcriptional regulator